MNLRKAHVEFESLIADIFIQYSIEFKRNQFVGDFEIDLILQKENIPEAFVEVKIYRSKKVPISQIKRALERLLLKIKEGNVNYGMLVVASFIESEIKLSLEKEFGITIWDRNSLYHLTENLPNLRERLENQLTENSEENGENIFERIEKNNDHFKIGDIWKITPKEIQPTIRKGKKLCKELNAIPAGKDDYKKFELKCQEILEYIFDNDLTSWHNQARTEDGLNQFDLICRIASTHDFWRSLSRNFNCRYILFEFKNYKDKIKQGQVYTTEKYLFSKALRSVGFIIAKNGVDKNAVTAMKGALREHGKLLVHLTPEDLCDMLERKDTGNDPNTYLAEKVDDFLIKLSR